MIKKIISKLFSNTYYVVIENKNIHIRCIEKDISKSIVAKIGIKDNRVMAVGEDGENLQNNGIEIYFPFDSNDIIFTDFYLASMIIRYVVEQMNKYRAYFKFHLLFHINKDLNRELYESEKYLLKSLANSVGVIDFGITQGKLLSDEEVLKFNFEKVENI